MRERELLTDGQWAAGRAMNEGNPATHSRVAACLGVHTTTVSHRAAEEGWESVDYRHARVRRKAAEVVELSRRIRAGEELDAVDPSEREGEDAVNPAWGEAAVEAEPWPDLEPGERIARMGAALTRQTETILRRVEAGQPLESRQVAALSNLVQLAERIATMAREGKKERQQKRDEDLAEVLDRINNRIIYLARELAAQVAWDILLEHGMSEEDIKPAFEKRAAQTERFRVASCKRKRRSLPRQDRKSRGEGAGTSSQAGACQPSG